MSVTVTVCLSDASSAWLLIPFRFLSNRGGRIAATPAARTAVVPLAGFALPGVFSLAPPSAHTLSRRLTFDLLHLSR